jgi:hypothetical protein
MSVTVDGTIDSIGAWKTPRKARPTMKTMYVLFDAMASQMHATPMSRLEKM